MLTTFRRSDGSMALSQGCGPCDKLFYLFLVLFQCNHERKRATSKYGCPLPMNMKRNDSFYVTFNELTYSVGSIVLTQWQYSIGFPLSSMTLSIVDLTSASCFAPPSLFQKSADTSSAVS